MMFSTKQAKGGTMARSGRKRLATMAVGLLGASAGAVAVMTVATPSAFANTQPYELYCPGTPVGNIVLNDVVTNGTITPATPASGQQFNLTSYQSTVTLPNSIASAAAALGNSAITGSAGIKIDATGATPATVTPAPIAINTPLPSPVPAAGLTLTLPATPGTAGPFTASGGAISLTIDPAVSLTVNVSGSALNLTCTPYPNNSAPSGISPTAPTAAKASPVIATASAGGAAAPPTTAAPAATPTTAAPSTAPASGTLATTGPGPHLWLVAVIGFIVLYLGSVALALVERPRSLLRRALRLVGLGRSGPDALPEAVTPAVPVPAMVSASNVGYPAAPDRVRPPAPEVARPAYAAPEYPKPAYPKAGGSQGLWFDGWEPDRT